MILTAEEEAMLAGQFGESIQWAMEMQMATGSYFGADRFQPVSHAHILVDMEVMGDTGQSLLRGMFESGVKFRVPTTTDIQFTDPDYAMFLGQDPSLVAQQMEVSHMLASMGAMTTNSCLPHQSFYQPHYGEHVAWGDTGAVCYANSIFGARSNFEAGTASLAAALTGRVPRYGFHVDVNRRGTVLVTVNTPLDDYADWGALGAYVGNYVKNYWDVPVLQGLSGPFSSDQLKHLAAALASYGSVALYGIVGHTPEFLTTCAWPRDSLRSEIRITRAEIMEVYRSYSPESSQADVVVFSGPQQSLFELKKLSEFLDGKTVNSNTQLIVTTSHGCYSIAKQLGYIDRIQKAGGLVLQGVCFYLMTLDTIQKKWGWRTVVTNSAKVANIIGCYDYIPVLRTTDDCIRSALTGKVVPYSD